MNTKIKIVFFGTSEFAIPPLRALLQNGYDVAAVVTNPDEPAGRKNILTPPPVKRLIADSALPIEIFQPEKPLAIRHTLLAVHPDLFIVAAYGKIIPKEILAIPKRGALNIHPSFLPRWRGPSPVQYTILHGDRETGVTIIKMDELADHGPIVVQKHIKCDLAHARAPELYHHLFQEGANLLIETFPAYLNYEITPLPQDDSKATYSKMLTKEDGRIDWSRSAKEIERMTRAFTPWPGAWTAWPDGGAAPRRLRIESADVVSEEAPEGGPGFVWSNASHPLLVKTGHGSLAIRILTIEGKKQTTAGSFLRGNRDFIGITLV